MRYRFTLNNDILGSFILPRNPGGWEDMSILFKRSPKYHGFFYEKTVNLEFFCGSGKEYIDNALNIGVDTLVNILMEVSCNCDAIEGGKDYSDDYSDDYGGAEIGECEYETLYQGKISLKTWSTINGRNTIDIIQQSIADTVINRADTPIDITKLETLDGTELTSFDFAPYIMNLHSKKIISFSKLGLSGSDDIANTPDIITPGNIQIAIPLGINIAELDTLSEYINFLTQGSSTSDSPDSIFTASETGDYKFDINLNGTFFENNSIERTYNLALAYRINSSNFLIYDYGSQHKLGGFSNTINLNDFLAGDYLHTTISLNAGDTISVFFSIIGYPIAPGGSIYEFSVSITNGYISFTKATVRPATAAPVFAILETGARIAQSITNQIDAFRSDYFGRKNSQPFAYNDNGCGSFNAITNGALIRGFPLIDQTIAGVLQAGRPVKMSLNQYFDDLNCIDNLGLGIENISGVDYIRIEPKSYFYNNSLIFRLSNIPNLKISVAPEYYYNTFSNGYAKWKIDNINGLDETNTIHKYDLGLKTISNPLELICNLITSSYMIEDARRKQFSDFFTEDFDTDNDNFIICLNRSVDIDGIPNNLTTAEKDENFSSVENVLDPSTSYNLRISPGRNTLRWSNVLNVGLLKYPARNIKFTYGEGNFKMVSQLADDSCPGRWDNQAFNEGQDIQWDDANNTDNSPLWEPLIADFSYPLTRNQYNIMTANPNGYIEISGKSDNYTKWFILEAKYTPVGGMTEFKLLKKWES